MSNPRTLDLEWAVSHSWPFGAVDILFRTARREQGHLLVAYPEPIVLTESEMDLSMFRPTHDPALRITDESAQALVDALWQEGIKPSEVQKQAHPGTISALQAHIDSLQTQVDEQQALIVRLFEVMHEARGDSEVLQALYNRFTSHLESEVRDIHKGESHMASMPLKDLERLLGSLNTKEGP